MGVAKISLIVPGLLELQNENGFTYLCIPCEFHWLFPIRELAIEAKRYFISGEKMCKKPKSLDLKLGDIALLQIHALWTKCSRLQQLPQNEGSELHTLRLNSPPLHYLGRFQEGETRKTDFPFLRAPEPSHMRYSNETQIDNQHPNWTLQYFTAWEWAGREKRRSSSPSVNPKQCYTAPGLGWSSE